MPYVDLATIHTPTTGGIAPASWGTQVRDNLEFLIDPPSCSVFNSAAQSIPTNTTTKLNADGENYDNDAMHSTVSNTSRLTIQTTGRYLVIASVAFGSGHAGWGDLSLLVNNTTTYYGFAGEAINALLGGTFQAVATINLSAGDYVEAQVFHALGVNKNVTLREFAATYLTR